MPRIHNVGGVRPQPFMHVPVISNVVTNGIGRGIENVLKGNVHLGFPVFCLQRYYCSESKPILYLDMMVYCKFILYVKRRNGPV